MKNNTERKTINVDNPNLMPLWTFKQDDDVILNLSLFKESVPFDISGQKIRLGAKTFSGLKEQIDGFDIKGNNLDIKLKNTILVPGLVEIDLEFIDVGGKMTSTSFFVNVNSRVLNDTAVQATNEFDTFKKTVEEITTDYKGLRRIVIDENNAANLQDQVNKTNSQLEQNKNRIEEVATTGTTIEAVQNKVSEMAQDGTITFDTIKPEMTTFINSELYPNLYKNSTGYYDGKVLVDVGIVENDISVITLKDYVTIETGVNYIASYNGNPIVLCARVFKGDTDIENYYGLPATRKTNILQNELMTTSDSQYKYLFISIYKSTLAELNISNDEFLKGFSIQKSTEIRPFEKYELKEEIKINKLEEIEKKLDELGLENPRNLLKDLTIKNNMSVSNVGWCYDKVGDMSLVGGIPIESGKTYAFGYGDNVLRANEILIKSENDINYNVQSTVIAHYLQKVFFTAPSNSKYLYFSVPNTLDKDKIRVYEGHSAMDKVINSSLNGKNMMSLGDSLSEIGMWQSYVIGRLGMNKLVNLAIGGTTVSVFANNVTADNIADIDLVTIMGFFNSNTVGSVAGEVTDIPSNEQTASICSGYKYIIEKLYSLKPELDIVIIAPHRPVGNDGGNKVDKLRELAKYYGIPFIDTYNEAGFNSFTIPKLLYDGIHSQTGEHDGYYAEGRYIAGQLIKFFG